MMNTLPSEEAAQTENDEPLVGGVPLSQAAGLEPEKWLNPSVWGAARFPPDAPVALVMLAAGKGTRFGTAPKCVQPVRGVPLACHSINHFEQVQPAPCICLVSHAAGEVMAGLGAGPAFVRSANPTGGTAFAAFETLCIPGLEAANPLLVITMGDRIVPDSVFRRLLAVHRAGRREADLTLLALEYVPPAQHGKGRILRDAHGRIVRIMEQRDIDVLNDPDERRRHDDLTEANCPLYVLRARTLRLLGAVHNDNAQQQYYVTDLVDRLARAGQDIRTLTLTDEDPAYTLLCSDVTRPADLARLESLLAAPADEAEADAASVAAAAEAILADRAPGQVAAIAAQLQELQATVNDEELGFVPDQAVAIGISGGRLRIAFMHPDMGRFYGPAWQMPTGAADGAGREQIVLLAQSAADGQIHHFPASAQFQEKVNAVSATEAHMFPSEEIADLYRYEEFGTRLAERLLLSLGYFSAAELQTRRERGWPLPPPSLWVANSMRRPFSLICNAIASLRTLRRGPAGERVLRRLGPERFQGLRLASTGAIPQGGFSSSSALTVAVKNALNVLFSLGIPADTLVHLACQAEYGTGVRAGSLDQATEQKGKAGQGALISSNPRENYRIIGVYPVPTARFHMIFPFSVDRDREAWQWSGGLYGADADTPQPTTLELRKLTGKVAEMAAVLTHLPPDNDFFPMMEKDLVRTGRLSAPVNKRVHAVLRALPLLVRRADLHDRLRAAGAEEATADGLLAGWREPRLRRGLPDGTVIEETGVPLRAMVAYLFVEVIRNFQLIHHPHAWIEWVTRSQRGDSCFTIDPSQLPPADELRQPAAWERAFAGPALLDEWLRRVNAVPFDYNQDLTDAALDTRNEFDLLACRGGSFFRGLALLDWVEAMLKRVLGADAVALRVNAAGQGDYFQVHVDTTRTDTAQVKELLAQAYYARFGLSPRPPFVEPHPGGGAVGVRLDRLDLLPALIRRLQNPR
ncbi:MAG: NTP transferase domain-containing protein [Candidatus Marinimicrobia bacterium]|nr:NTP transferase domain-containing protein [Candidatus Neomarinimicrobiota bacterium]